MMIGLADIPSLPENTLEEFFRDHCGRGFYGLLKLGGLNVSFVRAAGCSLWDNDGARYLDFIGGYGSLNTGHNHPG